MSVCQKGMRAVMSGEIKEDRYCRCGHSAFWHVDFGCGACDECSCMMFCSMEVQGEGGE